MGLDPLLLSFITVIIGGLGSLRGTIVAAFVIGISDGVISVFFSPTWQKLLQHFSLRWCWCSGLRSICPGEKLMHAGSHRALLAHLATIAALFALQFVLPAYHHTNFARIMVLATYAMGYNLLMGYAGLLSLAMQCCSCRTLRSGPQAEYLGFGPLTAFVTGVAAGCALSLAVGLIAAAHQWRRLYDRLLDVSQAAFLTTLYFSGITRGDEGFVLQGAARRMSLGTLSLDLSNRATRYNLALLLFTGCLMASFVLVRSSIGRVLIAIRENEERTVMLAMTATVTSSWLSSSPALCQRLRALHTPSSSLMSARPSRRSSIRSSRCSGRCWRRGHDAWTADRRH